MKLLILEARESVGAIIARLALQNGWEGIVTVSPEGLEQKIQEQEINALITEYTFPASEAPFDSLAAVEMLRNGGHDLPIILFTDKPEAVDQAKAKQLRILCILEKPLSIPEVRIALNEAKKLLDPPVTQ